MAENIGAIEYQVRADISELMQSVRKVDSATSKMGSAFSVLAKTIGGVLAFQKVTAMLADASNAAKVFEKSISDLSAITGATGDQLAYLRAQAADIGATTSLSASQAAEAFKLIASAKPDLLESSSALNAVTRSAVTLAEAAGMQLPDAADALGSSLNQFSLDASEADRVINVLAAGAKFGSSEIKDTAVALKNAGVSAASAKISFEETNAAIQVLSASAIKGGEAGTALRNMILKLETSTDQGLKPSVNGLAGALDNLAAKNLSTTKLVELFGLENVNAAQAILRNRDNLKELTDKMTDTNTAFEQAKTRTDNLDGSYKAFSSSAEALSIVIGDKLNPSLKESLDWTTKLNNALALTIDSWSEVPTTVDGVAFALAKVNERIAELESRGKRYGGGGLIATLLGDVGDNEAELAQLRKEAASLQDRYEKLAGIGAPEAKKAPTKKQEIAETEQVIELTAEEEKQKKKLEAQYESNQQRIKQMSDELKIAGLSTQGLERDAAMLAAEFSLGANATQAQIDKIREMAGAMYDLKEAERQRNEQEQQKKQAEAFATGVEMDAMNPLQRIDAEEQAKLAKLEEYRTADALSLQAYEDAKTAITTKAANDRVAYERQVASMLLSSSADMFGGMADLAKTFGGEQSGAYKAMFAVSKGFAVANAALQLQTAIANAMALPFPSNLPAIAQAVSLGGQVVSSIAGVSYGGGRRYGGPVNPGSMYQVNESGNPEMMIAGGKQYLLPNSRGEVIPSDSASGGAGVQWQIVVNNSAPGVDVQSSVNDETKTVTLAVQEVARQLGSRTGPVAQGLQRGFNVPGRTS